jgi:nicotinate-nucleotide adenylyltransferase
MASWREPERLFRLVEVAVVDRPGYDPAGTTPPLSSGLAITRVCGPALPISATEIRERARRGLSVRFLVPDTVADYIEARGLYR